MEANFDLYFCCVKMGEEEKERMHDSLMIRMDFVGNTIPIVQHCSYCPYSFVINLGFPLQLRNAKSIRSTSLCCCYPDTTSSLPRWRRC